MNDKPKYPPAVFSKLYMEYKDRGMNQSEIARELGISRTTLCTYLNDPDFRAHLTPKLDETEQLAVNQAAMSVSTSINRNEQIIDTAYKLHLKGIQDAIKDGDFREARNISIDALKIARTEAEIKRIFSVFTFVDNRSQITEAELDRKMEMLIGVIVVPALVDAGFDQEQIKKASVRMQELYEVEHGKWIPKARGLS
jgi:predicted transcriptional regulator